jgi:histone-lysine N-methyltransferase SETD3
MRTFDLQLMAEIVSLLRVAHADAGELAKLAEAPGALTLAKPLSGEGDEQKLIPLFAAICEERLAGYETSLEEDERILREEKLSHNARSCVLLRRGEKRILQTYARSCAGLVRP